MTKSGEQWKEIGVNCATLVRRREKYQQCTKVVKSGKTCMINGWKW